MNAMKTRRLIGLFLLGCLLFNYPILSIFNRAIFIDGVPLLYVYLFAAWVMIILLTAVICRQRRKDENGA
jgi:predicted permease